MTLAEKLHFNILKKCCVKCISEKERERRWLLVRKTVSGLGSARPRNVIKPVGPIIVPHMPHKSEKVTLTIPVPFVGLVSKANTDSASPTVEMSYA